MDSFKSALYHAQLIYDVDIQNEEPLIEIGLVAWNKIGKHNTRLYRLVVDVDCANKEVELPCNCEIIESVNYFYEDWNRTSNIFPNGDYHSQFTENYIEDLKEFHDPIYQRGKYVKYQRVGDTLIFEREYGPIQILYKGSEVDEEGLPYINEKQKDAIACYIAYINKFKEGMRTHNPAILQESQLLNAQWLKLCDAARVAEYMSQNDIDKVLDARTTFNRKLFNKSYKPV